MATVSTPMSSPIERRQWIEALHDLNVEYEKLLQIIVRLGQDYQKEVVVDAFDNALPGTPVEKENFVLIGNLALKFDDNDRLIDLFKAIPGTTERAEIIIESTSGP